jgi:hypothetical protein
MNMPFVLKKFRIHMSVISKEKLNRNAEIQLNIHLMLRGYSSTM